MKLKVSVATVAAALAVSACGSADTSPSQPKPEPSLSQQVAKVCDAMLANDNPLTPSECRSTMTKFANDPETMGEFRTIVQEVDRGWKGDN